MIKLYGYRYVLNTLAIGLLSSSLVNLYLYCPTAPSVLIMTITGAFLINFALAVLAPRVQ